MDPFDLPPELAGVERRLAERGRLEPAADLRRRVLAALHDEPMPGRPAWRLATLAAAVLLILNLAMSLENHRAWSHVDRIEDGDLVMAARALRQRHPDLSEQEAYQLAALIQAAPAVPVSLDRIVAPEGEQSWDMR